MLKNFSVSLRLFLLVICISLVSVFVGVMGLRGMTQAIASFDFVNKDHLVHLRDLKIISDQYTLNIIDSTMKVRSRQLPWAEAQKRLEQARQTVKDKWAAHPTDDFVGEEKKLVDKIEASFDKVNGLLDQLSTIYKDEEREDLGKFTDRQLYPAVEELTELLSEFMEAQLTEANNEFMTAQESYEFNRNLTIGLIVIGLLGGCCWLPRSFAQSPSPCLKFKKPSAPLRNQAIFLCASTCRKKMKWARPQRPSTAC